MKYAVTALVAVATVLGAHAQTTAFTYQGKLGSGTNAAIKRCPGLCQPFAGTIPTKSTRTIKPTPRFIVASR
ncbi:MAG TPA: hypothetical protein VLT36_16330 [Candidatus Dormibacteraeota bacterium]|nr:hypothetical protein [Candidatus Dormibacteraeota bacterium]